MARGKDKTILASDIPNMSPRDRGFLNTLIANRGITPKVRVEGTAVVRSSQSGNARYQDQSMQGNYNEDRL